MPPDHPATLAGPLGNGELRTPKLKIRGIRKTYGEVVALDDTDLDVEEGEFLTLLGPSGSGKTTLLMAVAGLASPDRGEIWIDDKPATHLPVFQRDIGMVFQSYALFPHLTVFENLAFPMRMRRLPDAQIKQQVARVLDVVRLPDFADRFPSELSGGQQQRVALARCVIYRPSIILMDEPLGALDKRLREQMQYEIKQLHITLGTTIVYVTHDQDEALAMSDRIALMRNAGIEQIGSPSDLYFRPASVFAAEFFGESNIFPAVPMAGSGRTMLRGPDDSLIASPLTGDVGSASAFKAMVRPEAVRILDAGEPGENVLLGTVRNASMLGSITRYAITTRDGTQLIVKELTSSARRPAAVGAEVRVGWAARDTIVFERDARRA